MQRRLAASVVIAILALGACGQQEPPKAENKGPPATPVTVAAVSKASAVDGERVLGRIESAASPQVNAEVPGTVARVIADVGDSVEAGQVLAELDTTDLRLALDAARSEVGRLQVLHANQDRTVKRLEQLQAKNLVAAGNVEDAEAQLQSLAEQLSGARARKTSAERALSKARITAPIGGVIAARHAAVGDYVDAKTVLFDIASAAKLRVHLPFPESLAPRLVPGLSVRLSSPIAPEQTLTAAVDSVRPVVAGSSRAVEAIVQVNNPGNWREGASVNAEVILAERAALLVPEQSIVRRPAGEVVYVLSGDIVEQRAVTTGIRRDGQVEILAGLTGDETVVVDGAGFLTDKARVMVKK